MSIATLSDIEFVTQLEAVLHDYDPIDTDYDPDGDHDPDEGNEGHDWPRPATAAQALALADVYGVDGESSTDHGDPEIDAVIVALCVLAKAYREAVL